MDDAGLDEFHKNYYPYPIYKDVDLRFYEALGNGSITEHISWNPFKVFATLRKHNKRLKAKGLDSWNLKGEGFRTGGVIIFGKDGSPQLMAPEVTGTEINEDEFLAALEIVRNGGGGGEL